MPRSTAFEIAWVGNNNTLELRALRDERTGEFLDAAAVTVTIRDAAGAPITGETWPKAVVHVEGSKGVYQANISYQAAFVPEGQYTAVIDVDAGDARRGHWELPLLAKVRRS